MPPQPWGATTRSKKGDKVYVHVLDPKVDEVVLPGQFAGAGTRTLKGDKIDMTSGDNKVTVKLPASLRDPIDTVVVLQLAK